VAIRRTYVRPMQGWWRRNPYFVRYMAREATALFVVIYAMILLAGLTRLSHGEAEFGEWLEGLAGPGSIAFHLVLLAVFAYHTWSWFRIMPKTMPPVLVRGRPLAGSTLTALGIAAAIVASAALFLLVRVLA
jgi:fumarate reductase subunit C